MDGLFELVSMMVVAIIVYFLGKMFPNDIVQRLSLIVAINIAAIALLAYLRLQIG